MAYTVSSAYHTAIKDGVSPQDFMLVDTEAPFNVLSSNDGDFVAGSPSIVRSVCESTDFTLGECPAATLSAAVLNTYGDTAEFWSAVEFLLVNGEIQTGYDIKLIFNKPNITIGNMTYSQPMTILYLNPDRVFKLYAQQRRRTSTAKERNIPESTLKFYLQRSDEYLGTKSTPFKVPTRNLNPDPDNHHYGSELFGQPVLRKQTRAWVFDYKRLKENYDISLEINLMTEEEAE